jgi:ABC-type glutathione transport system ATPase component
MPYEKYQKVTIDCDKIRPHTHELVNRCGTIEGAAKYSGVGKTTIARIMHGVNCSVQRATATKIMQALDRRRAEDRRNYSVNKRMIEARKQQARIEEDQERLVGY